MNETHPWFYVRQGEQVGPLDLEAMKRLIELGTVDAQTKVWNGHGGWVSAQDSTLAEWLTKRANNVDMPPPLKGADVDNRYVWGVVAVPVVGAVIEWLAGMSLWWLYLAANVVLCVLDEKKLKKAGQRAPTNWMVFLVPLYLWKRAVLLEQKKHAFWAWCGAFLLSVLIAVGGEHAALEEAACPVVTQILQRQLLTLAQCKAVTITEQVSGDFYRAIAVLDNGEDLKITIEKRKDGQIFVRVVP